MASQKELIKITKSWIADFVIGRGLCPFAQRPFDQGLVHYTVTTGTADLEILEAYWENCSRMLDTTQQPISNMFLLLPEIETYDHMLDLEQLCISFMEESKLDAIFQVVCFHPDFTFANEPEQAAGHYVNRSPVPMLHILRVQEVEAATANIVDAEDIPNSNKLKLEALGSDQLATMLKMYRA